jgi:REP element-mobilizing transposase RayT
MAGDRYAIKAQNEVHFSTFTVVHWMDVFIRNEYKDIIVNNLNFCIENKGLELYCWCLMTSHLHLIARAKEGFALSDIYRDCKKFTAKKIIEGIQSIPESRREWMMRGIEKQDKDKNDVRKFWKADNHNIIIYSHSPHIFEQKKDYVHMNPVEAGFVNEPFHWKYSSAIDYSGGKGLVNVVLN